MSDLDPLSAPEITLRGATFRLPQLELRQAIPITARLLKFRSKTLGDLDEAELFILYDIAYLAMASVDPALTREEFDLHPPAYHELLKAFPVIMQQAGFTPRSAATSETTPGEAQAETSTGTTS